MTQRSPCPTNRPSQPLTSALTNAMPYVHTDDFESYITDVINRCKDKQRSGWEDLFQLFHNHIKQLIIDTLKENDRLDLVKQEDTVPDIFVRFYESAILSITDLEHPLAAKRWLSQIAYWRTIDYLNTLNTQKRRLIREVEKNTASLDEVQYDASDTTLADTIAAPERCNTFDDALADVMKVLESLDAPKRWALRLKAIYYQPLEEKELDQLARYTGKPADRLNEEIDALMDALAHKAADKTKSLGDAARVEVTMKNLVNRLLFDMAAGSAPEDRIIHSQREVIAHKKNMKKLEIAGQQPIVPSNKQLAVILGIPKGKEDNISTAIFRARKILRNSKAYHEYMEAQKEAAELWGRQ